MMPSWLWTFILLLVVVPIHVLAVSPALVACSPGTRFSVALGYLALGILWAFAGDRTRMVRR